MFTYGPGRVPPPAHLGIPTGLIAGSFPPGGVIQNRFGDPKRLHVTGFKEDTTDQQLLEFFNGLMNERQLVDSSRGEPIEKCQIASDKTHAFLDVSFLHIFGTKGADETSSAHRMMQTKL